MLLNEPMWSRILPNEPRRWRYTLVTRRPASPVHRWSNRRQNARMHNQPRLSMSMPDPVHRRTSMRLKPRRHNPTLLNLSMPNKVDGRTNMRLESSRHSPTLLNLSVERWSRSRIHVYTREERKDQERVGRKRNKLERGKRRTSCTKLHPTSPPFKTRRQIRSEGSQRQCCES